MSKVATVIKIAVLLLFGILGIVHAMQNGFSEVFVGANWIPEISDIGALTLVTAIVFNLLGFELVAAIGDTVDNPEKTLPKAIIIGAALIGFLYIFATFGVLQAATLADLSDEIFIVDGFIISMEILTASVFGAAGPIMFKIIMAGALFTLIMNMISWVIGANEILEDADFAKMYPVFTDRHPKYNTLSKSYILMGVISSILILVGLGLGDSGDEAFWTILAFSMVIFIFPYIYLTPAVLKLRKQDGVENRHFVIPGGTFGLNISAILNFVFIALALVLLLVVNPGYDLYYPVVITGTIITTGVGIWFYKKGQQ
jgi:amino acid transporter